MTDRPNLSAADAPAGAPPAAPDPAHTLLGLMASVVRAGGVPDWPWPPVPWLDAARLASARTLIVLVVDGLGDAFLRARGGALAEHRAGTLRSVVPSTTASAITTFMTAQPPAAHGLIGWFVHDPALGAPLCPLPATRRGGGPLTAESLAELYTAPSIYPALQRECHVVQPVWLCQSAYTLHHAGGAQRHGYRDLPEFTAVLPALARADGAARFVYAYWPELDRLAHRYGIGSAQARAHFGALDEAFARLAEALAGEDVVVLVCADHGFVDVAPEHVLDPAQVPAVAEALAAPLSGEPRLAYARVHAALRSEFPQRLAQAWGACVTVWPASEFIASGQFGPGPAHPRLAARCGDFVLVPADGYMLRDRVPGERAHPLIGVHGGYSADERDVPLVWFDGLNASA